VFVWRGAISEIPRLFEVWKDPKTNSTMYMKDILKDWTSTHLSDSTWYLDYLKDNIFPSEFKIWEKHELNFFLRIWNLGEGDTKQEEIGGGKKEVKEKSLGVWIKNAGQGKCSHLIPKKSSA
jgi:hypothetical protein